MYLSGLNVSIGVECIQRGSHVSNWGLMYVDGPHVCGRTACMWTDRMYVDGPHVCGRTALLGTTHHQIQEVIQENQEPEQTSDSHED